METCGASQPLRHLKKRAFLAVCCGTSYQKGREDKFQPDKITSSDS